MFKKVVDFIQEVYKTKDFEVVASYHDPDLRAAFEDMPLSNSLEGVDLDEAAEVSVCVHRPPPF